MQVFNFPLFLERFGSAMAMCDRGGKDGKKVGVLYIHHPPGTAPSGELMP
jgi:hypothetical protein